MKKIEDDLYRWNREFLELWELQGIKPYINGDKQYSPVQEVLCDTLANGDVEKYVYEMIPWIHKDAFGRGFLTLPDPKI